jgi:hypothetical protein
LYESEWQAVYLRCGTLMTVCHERGQE